MPSLNSIDASAGTAPPAVEAVGGDLGRRALSALVVAPPAILAAWFGLPYLGAIVLAAVLVLAWEWDRMCDGRFSAAGLALALSVGVAGVFGWMGMWAAGIAAVAVGFAVVLGVEKKRQSKAALWAAFGALYIGLPALALFWLRGGEAGRDVVLWLIAVTVATDIAAYFVGRTVRGAKLAPHISPGKTWAGLAGGMAAAAAIGGLGGGLMGGSVALLGLLGAVLAVVGQLGDLFESAAKRRFGLKDMGGILPGHGGLFDRVDGLIVVILTVAALTLLSGVPVNQW